MKRNIFLFAVILAMGLTACGNESTTSNETTDSTSAVVDTTVVTDSATTQETVDSAVKQ